MKFYIGVNEDGSEMLSKLPLKRFIDYNATDTIIVIKEKEK